MFNLFKSLSPVKKIGLVAFILTELLIFTVVLLSLLSVKDVTIDYTMVIGYQVGVFTIVWGAKAVSNFAKKKG